MRREGSRHYALAWLRKAQSDLRNAEIVLAVEDPPLDTVAFHAQQVAEKAIKALLTAAGLPFPKIHDLEALAGMLPSATAEVLAIDPEVLSVLTQFAVAARYPGWADEDFDRGTVEDAVASARQILEAAHAWVSADTEGR